MVLKDNHGQIIQQHQVTHTAAAPSIALHSLVTKAVEKPSVEQQLDSSKKKLHDAEMQLQKLKANIASKPTPPAVAHLSPTVKKAQKLDSSEIHQDRHGGPMLEERVDTSDPNVELHQVHSNKVSVKKISGPKSNPAP